MGKNKRKQIQFKDDFHNIDLSMDSLEECDFCAWCCEAAKLGIIQDFSYQPSSISLSDSISYITYENKKRILLREHIYSPDFMVQFNPKASRLLCKEFKLTLQQAQQESFQTFLDVKGTFQRSDGGRVFAVNQKWVYQKTGIYILKIIPKEFFAKCGCPLICFYTKKTNKLRTAFLGFKKISEIFASDLTKIS